MVPNQRRAAGVGKNTDEHGRARTDGEGLIPRHGRYRTLKTFQLAETIYDVTVRFCEKYLDPRSRTVDQMTQAARSGRQNIAEGSVDSAISKKMELKLTGVAKGSLEELRLDYEDYLRQRGLPMWAPDHPALERFRARGGSRQHGQEDTDDNGQTQTRESDAVPGNVGGSLCSSMLVANGALSLINLCVYLLGRQINAQAEAFEKDGGFTERLYRKRMQARRRAKD